MKTESVIKTLGFLFFRLFRLCDDGGKIATFFSLALLWPKMFMPDTNTIDRRLHKFVRKQISIVIKKSARLRVTATAQADWTTGR